MSLDLGYFPQSVPTYNTESLAKRVLLLINVRSITYGICKTKLSLKMKNLDFKSTCVFINSE